MYRRLLLKRIDGRQTAIRVEPGFTAGDLRYHPWHRAVSLGKLTVLYHGIVYDVQPRSLQ